MRSVSAPRYFLASVLLLSALVSLFALSSGRRSRQELLRQLEDKGLALAETVEIASRSAIRGNALMEEMIANRLLDNARLIDALLRRRPLGLESLAAIREANGLRRIDLLDLDGRPLPPPPPRPRAMRQLMADPSDAGRIPHHRSMMRFMWGRRWGPPPPPGIEGGPPPIRDRTFWEGTVFGVAIGARSFPGIIAVHADAAYVLNFREEIGVEQQIEELGRQSGVEAVALLSPDLSVLAHSNPRQVGTREDDPFLKQALGGQRSHSRMAASPGGAEVFEIVRALELDGGAPLGLLQVRLATEPLRRAWRRDLWFAVALGLSVLLAGGLGLGFIFYMQDRHLSHIRTLEVEVERRERLAALGNLAATVAHEVRNPLNAISMGLQRLREEFPPAHGAHARVVELTQGEVRRLNGIIEQFLSLARPVSLTPELTNPGALLREVASLVDAEARGRGIHLTVVVGPELPPTRLDRDHVKQVLLNLIQNAFQATASGGTLTLGAATGRERVILTVEDTGEGIPLDLLSRIFEPYVTTKTRGTGLGLAIARRIVEAHGGRLSAESRPGGGSRFTISLPREDPSTIGRAADE